MIMNMSDVCSVIITNMSDDNEYERPVFSGDND